MFGGFATAGAAALGWLDAGFRLTDGDRILLTHRWTGTALGVMGFTLALCAWRRPASVASRLMTWRLGLTSMLLLFQGWLGGALIYGVDHMISNGVPVRARRRRKLNKLTIIAPAIAMLALGGCGDAGESPAAVPANSAVEETIMEPAGMNDSSNQALADETNTSSATAAPAPAAPSERASGSTRNTASPAVRADVALSRVEAAKPSKAVSEAEPSAADPHAGHDMNNMSHESH